MKVPIDLAHMFSMPRVPAHMVGITQIDGTAVDPQVYLLPCLAVLPMGWSWSLHFCQQVVRSVCVECCGTDRIIEDHCSGVVLSSGNPIGVAAYVDNIGVFGTSKEAVDKLQQSVAAR